MATTTRRVTAEELLRMPRGGFRYELVRREFGFQAGIGPRNVRVHRPQADVEELGESDTLEVGDVVPGWRMAIREIFE